MASSTTDPFAGSITTVLNGQAAFPPWNRNVKKAANSADCGTLHGLSHKVVTAEQWLLFPGVEGEVNVEPPERPADDATPSQLQVYREELELYQRYERMSKQLWNAIINSLSPVYLLDITNTVTGTVIMTIEQIMAHFHLLFGVPNASAIEQLKKDLKKPLLAHDITTFIDHSSTYIQTVGELANAGQPLSMADQMTKFTVGNRNEDGYTKCPFHMC